MAQDALSSNPYTTRKKKMKARKVKNESCLEVVTSWGRHTERVKEGKYGRSATHSCIKMEQ
jgi:hypothetical protein